MSGADGPGWAGAASTQRAGQVVSTTQTPGPSQTREVKRLTQAKDIKPVFACVYISFSSQQTFIETLFFML